MVYNTLGVLAAAKALEVSLGDSAHVLRHSAHVKGRVEVVPTPWDYTMLIDYAHTPDALENVLTSAKGFARGRVVALFGCGGDRDRTKRPKMGRIAAALADFVIVTSDNPRTESREAIAGDVLAGVNPKGQLYVELDRSKAIGLSMELADKGDVVFIAGKGSENYIDENNIKTPYSDMGEVMSRL